MTALVSRRQFLALGVGAAAVAVLAGSAASAAAATVTVDGLIFEVPPMVRPVPAGGVAGGSSWQWRGMRPAGPGSGAMVVLARADLASTDAGEVLALLLAGGLAGALPGLNVSARRSRPMPGGGEQLRYDLALEPAPDLPYTGVLLIATRESSPAGVLAVLGDQALTAGELTSVLDSVRWAA